MAGNTQTSHLLPKSWSLPLSQFCMSQHKTLLSNISLSLTFAITKKTGNCTVTVSKAMNFSIKDFNTEKAFSN